MRASGRALDAFAPEGNFDGVHRASLCPHYAEDTPYDVHLLFVHHVVVPRGVVPEPIVRAGPRHEFPLACLLKLAPPRTLGYLGPLVLAELVEDAVGELSLRALVATVIEGAYPGAVLLELPPEQVVISGFAWKRSLSCASTTETPPAATKSRTLSMPGRSSEAPLCPG